MDAVIDSAIKWIVGTLLAGFAGFVVAQVRTNRALRLGVQALLRDRLKQGYAHYESKGWADLDDRSNLENIFVQYESLGKNGVMTNAREKFLELPNHPPHN